MNSQDRIIRARLDGPEARALVAELGEEYATRYADYDGFDIPDDAPDEIDMYPAVLFTPPYGDLLIVQRAGESIAGGAFMYLDDDTAEIKRVWTSKNHRRQGLSRTIMAALEEAIVQRGYRYAYLSTGPRQPEAKNLYLRLGYTPLFDLEADPESIGELPFEKELAPHNPGIRLRGVWRRLAGRRQRRLIERSYQWKPVPTARLKHLSK